MDLRHSLPLLTDQVSDNVVRGGFTQFKIGIVSSVKEKPESVHLRLDFGSVGIIELHRQFTQAPSDVRLVDKTIIPLTVDREAGAAFRAEFVTPQSNTGTTDPWALIK